MFKTANEFCLFIETLAKEKNLGYLDTILHYCEKNELEPEDVADMINSNLRDKVALEMQEINLLPKSAKLDV